MALRWMIMVGIEFGAMIPQGWLRDLPLDVGPEEQWRAMVRVARALEDLGFTSGWLFDHFHPVVGDPHESPCFEAWSSLMGLIPQTSRLRLGHMVLCNNYRHPSVLAKMASTADAASGGRLELGYGAGWFEAEYDAYGIPFRTTATRIRMMAEGVQVLKVLWTQEDGAFHGRFYDVEGAINLPKPMQKPHPPITIGGRGEQLTLRAVARLADRWNISGPTPEEYTHKLEVLRRHCGEVGRNFDTITKSVNLNVVIAEDEGEIRNIIQESPRGRWDVDKPFDAYYREWVESPAEMIGTPEEIVHRMRPFLDLGAQYIVANFSTHFSVSHDLRPLELFAREVMPAVREAVAARA